MGRFIIALIAGFAAFFISGFWVSVGAAAVIGFVVFLLVLVGASAAVGDLDLGDIDVGDFGGGD